MSRIFVLFRLLATVAAFGMVSVLLAQSFAPRWVRTHNSAYSGSESVDDIQMDGQGNPVVLVEVPKATADRALVLTKYSRDGSKLWTQSIKQDGCTVGYAYNHPSLIRISKLDDSITVVCNAQFHDFRTYPRLYCFDSGGNPLWNRQLSGIFDSNADFEAACDAAIDDQGFITVVGQSTKADSLYGGAFISKIAPDGTTVWQKIFTVSGWDVMFRRVVLDSKGKAYVAAWSFLNYHPARAFALAYSPTGRRLYSTEVSVSQLSGPIANGIVVDRTGAATMVGYGYRTSTNADACSVKVDALGNQVYGNAYQGLENQHDVFYGAAVDRLGNVYMCGRFRDYAETDANAVVLITDANGKTLQTKRFIGVGNGIDQFNKISVDAAGTLHAVGFGYAHDAFSRDAMWCRWLNPLSDNPNLSSTYAYGSYGEGAPDESFVQVAMNEFGEVFLGGNGNPAGNEYAVTVKVEQAPVVKDDHYQTKPNTSLTVNPGVLANDFWTQGATATAVDLYAKGSGITQHGGHFAIGSDGSLSYTPRSGFTGTDHMGYVALRGGLRSPLHGLVSISVQP